MFTGIVEELGTVVSVENAAAGSRITIDARLVTSDIANGDSISVNGVCLTAVDVAANSFSADVSPETLQRTTINELRIGSSVNLERAATPTTRLGGHFVQGHVDGRGTFLGSVDEGDFRTVTIGFPAELARYFVEKGSVAVDGISLTIARLYQDRFDIAIIPKTSEMTNIATHMPGAPVNLEVDVIAKYVERLLKDERVSTPYR